MWDVATLNQLLVLANLESYNAVLIKLGNGKKNRIFFNWRNARRIYNKANIRTTLTN